MSSTQVVYEDDSVRVAIEPHVHYGVLIHVISKRWGKGIFKHYMDVFIELTTQLQEMGYPHLYAAITGEDTKLRKFASMFGFIDTRERVKDTEGNERGIYKCLI